MRREQTKAEPGNCDACGGHGYLSCSLKEQGRPPVEIQRCDACEEFKDDDEARVVFVVELERGIGHAIEAADTLTMHGGPETE